MGEPAEPYVFRRWVAGAIMDGRYKAEPGREHGVPPVRDCISSNSRSPPSEASAKPRPHPRFHPRLPRASAEHTPGCAVYEPGRPGCLLTRCPVRVPPRQISESVCLDLGIIAGASVSVQWWVCDLGRDMTLMFDEACCWWIWCSCRPLAGSRCSCLLFTQM